MCKFIIVLTCYSASYTCFQGEVQKHETVGAFQKIPMVMPATDILMSAQRKSRNVPPTKGKLYLIIY
jgi:hypothetical protein